ncbi:efflux RND transporter permease subunit [Endozoicomonas sp.]|uniref:efflux RND transporter permease subunit n=1 Tax=Endozoicomonas sp. TaxID=1892382 RepID=UPI0028867360|nr:efflux RND transporter permease subunit [Endozoicomonas sp.]
MNIAEYTLKKSFIAWVVTLLVLIGGWMAYQNLARFEDPEFVIRSAMIITQYPGADPEMVAEQVTDKLEEAIQTMQEVDEVTSVSETGLSKITVSIKREFAPDKENLQQSWDKLRRKINDIKAQLPPDAKEPIVQDDYGDVYGLYYAVTGDGYSNRQIQNYVDMLMKEIAKVPGVARTTKQAQHSEGIFVEVSRERAARLGVNLNTVIDVLNKQNKVSSAGSLEADEIRIPILPKLYTTTIDDISELTVAMGADQQLIRIKDLARVYRDYQPHQPMTMYYNGQPAIGFGIANISGGNVVAMGDAVKAKLAELDSLRPVGMELHPVSIQSDSVRQSVDGFVINLAAAVAIVFIVLLLFMGVRSGIIIGFVLLLIVASTMIIMLVDNIAMQRISLGALIIALGMLVDNAIVVTDGILVRLQKGEERRNAVSNTVKATVWPLLGGTIVGILAFSAIGLSPSDMGEYAGSLFWVICYSMFMSWVFAITITPLLCHYFLKADKVDQNAKPSRTLHAYRSLLVWVLGHRLIATSIVIAMLLGGLVALGNVPSGFVPDSQRPQFVVDLYLPQGTDIRKTDKLTKRVADLVRQKQGVTNITSLVGAGGLRFMLTYAPNTTDSGYGQLLIDVEDFTVIPGLVKSLQEELTATFPQASFKVWKFMLGPGGGKKIEAAFSGSDPVVLRQLSEQAKTMMADQPDLIAVQDDWREQTAVLKPVYRTELAQKLGLSQSDLNLALEQNFSGRTIGAFREGNDLIPIILRAPEAERERAEQINDVMVSSNITGSAVPISELIKNIELVWQDAMVRRIDRTPTIKAQSDPAPGVLTGEAFAKIRPLVEAIPLPPGYTLEWHGEYKSSSESNGAIVAAIPWGFLAMVLAVIIMFNGWRQPLVIWLTAPLAIIGVAIGLSSFNEPLEFMALLGFLSLIGMLIKNAIVLVDQADVNVREGMEPYHAIIDAALSRARPVILGALTTIMGVAPLLADPFFKSMTIAIMFGLLFATVLTLIVVPLFYSLVFRIKPLAVH